MAAGEAGLKWCWYPSLWQISFPAVRMTKPLHRWQVTAGLPSGVFDSPAETSGALFLCLYLALVTRMSRLSPQSVSQGGSCHGETHSDTSQMIPLSSELCFLGAPLTLPLVHLPAGKGNCISEQATSLLRSFTDQPLQREVCFLLAGTPSASRAPVTDEIPWLSSCLMSFLPANSHVGPGSHFSSAFLPFHLHREKNGPEVTAVTLWLLVLMGL